MQSRRLIVLWMNTKAILLGLEGLHTHCMRKFEDTAWVAAVRQGVLISRRASPLAVLNQAMHKSLCA